MLHMQTRSKVRPCGRVQPPIQASRRVARLHGNAENAAKGLVMARAIPYIGGSGESRHTAEEATMEWRTPKLVEIACGCEINAYFPADL